MQTLQVAETSDSYILKCTTESRLLIKAKEIKIDDYKRQFVESFGLPWYFFLTIKYTAT